SPRHHAPVLAVGAAGGRRIISALVQAISGVVDLELGLREAVAQPRVHPRLRGGVWLERPAAEAQLVERLSRRHGEVQVRIGHSYSMGAIQALQLRDTEMTGAADPSRDGTTERW